MPRIYGYSLREARCYGKHDWGAKGRINVIGGHFPINCVNS